MFSHNVRTTDSFEPFVVAVDRKLVPYEPVNSHDG